MARAFLALCALASLAARASAQGGSILALWSVVNGNSSGLNPTWVVPHPTRGPTPGCTNLPAGFVPRSGRFAWVAPTSGQYTCSHFLFFYERNCGRRLDRNGEPVGGEQAIKRGTRSQTIINDFAALRYANQIPLARSVGCAFTPPACSVPALRCSDPNAECVDSTLTLVDGGNDFPAHNTRLCPCKAGFVILNGTCTDPCATKGCPADATCKLDATSSAYCQCPGTLTFNPTSNTCVDASEALWTAPVMALRRARGVTAPLAWSNTLARQASAHAAALSAQRCPAFGFSGLITLFASAEAGSRAVSENRGYMSGSTAESDAINLWVPNWGAPIPDARLTRFISPASTHFGCGKALCPPWGAFFVCQFSPRSV